MVLAEITPVAMPTLSPSNAVNAVGIAVGVSIGGGVLIMIVAFCIFVWCCIARGGFQSRRRGQTAYVGTAAPATTATVVSTAGAYPAGGYSYLKQVRVCVCAYYLIGMY